MPLAHLVTAKWGEQVTLAQRLVDRIPASGFSWAPELPSSALSAAPMPLASVLDHLQQSLAGVAATLARLDPVRFAALLPLRPLGETPPQPNAAAWRARFQTYWDLVQPALGALSDADLAVSVPTVFQPGGEAVLTLLLGNFEHFLNHKYQLYFYLKLQGLPVSTSDLYQLR